MQISKDIAKARGLTPEVSAMIEELCDVYNRHIASNLVKQRYYDGHVTLGEVNLGLALPKGIEGLEIGCSWGEKTVDVLASRSMFDGFVGMDGSEPELMTQIMADNRLLAEYMKACKDELKFGCTFATLSADEKIGCRIRFHSPETAAAVWDGTKGRIGYGLAIIDTQKDERDDSWKPSIINVYTDDAIWVLTNIDRERWSAEKFEHIMGRPLMEALIWNATSKKPFGRSRLKYSVRNLIKGYVRTVANATIGLEFATSPQKYILGVTDQQYDALINEKFRAYIGSIIASTTNPETGEKPSFGQLPQGTIEPHVSMLRLLATQFSAESGLAVTDVGVVNDANPTSADAINAQSWTLVLMAQQLNAGNGDALYTISQMAQAIARDVSIDDLTDEEKSVKAHFKNPSMPSIAAAADAALKIASVRPEFGQSNVFLEMLGYDQAEIRRIRGQEARARGNAILNQVLNDANIAENME